MNHWKISMNHGWCLSLSAAMHEFGHTMGLGHADDEMSAYMGASYSSPTWPRKCYNGYNNHHLEWFSDREWQWNVGSTQNDIALATFVDYDKTTANEHVLVNVANKFFLQYNRKKDFNVNTEDAVDKVTIHGTLPAEDTKLLAALAVGESFHLSNPSVYVKVCRAYTSPASGADVMHVSFAPQASNLCKGEPIGGGGGGRSDSGGGGGMFGKVFFQQLINAIIAAIFGAGKK